MQSTDTLVLFDTLSKSKIAFPIVPNQALSLYVCGVTPYDTTHIGHARTFLIFDVLIRYVLHRGGRVRYCRNITDVDDPLFERAKRDGIGWDELAQRESNQFLKDCLALNLVPPDYAPRVSEEIGSMIPIIADLIARGNAYAREGNVYFDVSTTPDYGAMARDLLPTYEAMLAEANQRGNDPADPLKRDPLDFVLWRRSDQDEPAWQSPWGPGRPGWHIECSAMSYRYLGPQIDIHGGGRDLVFPHHPSEVVQSECYTGQRPFVKCWVHGGFAWLDGEKMSKSRGNLVFVRDALREHGPNTLRWYLYSFPYRDDFNYQRAEVVAVAQKLRRLEQALAAPSGSREALDLADAYGNLLELIRDDLQTHLALPVLYAMIGEVIAASDRGQDVRTAQGQLRALCDIFGFRI